MSDFFIILIGLTMTLFIKKMCISTRNLERMLLWVKQEGLRILSNQTYFKEEFIGCNSRSFILSKKSWPRTLFQLWLRVRTLNESRSIGRTVFCYLTFFFTGSTIFSDNKIKEYFSCFHLICRNLKVHHFLVCCIL